MDAIVKISMAVAKVSQFILVILLLALVVDVTWQVITRFILPKPSSFTEELARFLLIWISLLGAALTYQKGAHLGFDLISSNLMENQRDKLFRAIAAIVGIVSFFVLIVGGGNLVLLTHSLGQHSSVMGIPMAFVYAVVPISGVLFCLFSLEKLLSEHHVVYEQGE
jgi:TRAP-type C4-dicarboxylate transport system permease small subunit